MKTNVKMHRYLVSDERYTKIHFSLSQLIERLISVIYDYSEVGIHGHGDQ